MSTLRVQTLYDVVNMTQTRRAERGVYCTAAPAVTALQRHGPAQVLNASYERRANVIGTLRGGCARGVLSGAPCSGVSPTKREKERERGWSVGNSFKTPQVCVPPQPPAPPGPPPPPCVQQDDPLSAVWRWQGVCAEAGWVLSSYPHCSGIEQEQLEDWKEPDNATVSLAARLNLVTQTLVKRVMNFNF